MATNCGNHGVGQKDCSSQSFGRDSRCGYGPRMEQKSRHKFLPWWEFKPRTARLAINL